MAEWTAVTPEGAVAEATYDGTSHVYQVSVTFKGRSLKENFRAGYPPRFGIDVSDAERAGEVAERLLRELEKE